MGLRNRRYGVAEENSSNSTMKQSPSSSVYSCESKEDLEEGSALKHGTIEPARASCECFI